ncbi:MAG TPA: hypothetical protein VL404_00870 [Candidatus Eisenbacteria bacterium]|jgi:hypothetical protein|nr:hypothetical protein [Candidatus Eisenbacteria bacterium]
MRARQKDPLAVPITLAFAAVLIFAAAFTYYAGLQGPGVDRIVSEIVSRRAGFPVQLLDVHITRWKDVRFGLLSLEAEGGKTLLAAGQGRILFEKVAFVKGDRSRVHLELNDVAILEGLYQKSSLFRWASKDVYSDPIYVSRAELLLIESADAVEAHLTRFDSEDVLLGGGLRMEKGKVVKVNVQILLPEMRFEKVPKELRARMIRRADRWRGVRLEYFRNTLTVFGSGGPVFKARWQ